LLVEQIKTNISAISKDLWDGRSKSLYYGTGAFVFLGIKE